MSKFFDFKIAFKVLILFSLLYITPLYAQEEGVVLPDISEMELQSKSNSQINETIVQLKEKIKKDPKNYEYYSNLAFVHDYMGRYKEALEMLEQGLGFYNGPDLDVVYLNMAKEHMRLNDIDNAFVYANKAIENNSKDAYGHVILLDYYMLEKDYKKAAIEMKILSDFMPERDIYYNTFLRFSNAENAKGYDFLALFDEALKQNPNNHYAIRVDGLIKRKFDKENFLKNFNEIIRNLQRAYNLKPDYIFHTIGISNAYFWQAVYANNSTSLQFALKWMEKAYELEPDNPKVIYGMGYIYLYMQRNDEAISFLEDALFKGVTDENTQSFLAQAYNNKAYSFYQQGTNLEEGLMLIDKALILQPEDGIILGTKAELLYKMKEYEKAFEYIQKAIKFEPDNDEIKSDFKMIEEAATNLGPK